MSEKKQISIDQRVPIIVLENAMIYLLRGELRFKEEVLRDLSEHLEGRNRIEKSFKVIRKVLFSTDFAQQIQKEFTEQSFLQLQASERKGILLLLLTEAYPFIFDLVSSMTKTLRVQTIVNTNYINTNLATLYGSNRTLYVGISSILTMLCEIGIYVRPKKGLYAKSDVFPIYNTTLIHLIKSIVVKDSILEEYFSGI
jgi:hypothetical protein